MNGDTLQHLRQASPAIRDRWEALLRSAPPTTPVSNLDAMTGRIPDSLAQILRALSWASVRRMPRRPRPAARRCAHNPFRAYFRAGEQAILESMATATAAAPRESPPDASNRSDASDPSDLSDQSAAADPSAAAVSAPTADPADAAALTGAVDRLAGADLDAFCRVCRKYRLVSVCRCGRG